MYTNIISVTELQNHLDDPAWVLVDCRFSLQDLQRGRRDYLSAHIPGAVYADLNADLSSTPIQGQTGRHPLPSPAAAAAVFSAWGIGPGVQVVAYDDAGGALAAVRLWWLLRWLGHDAAAVLDGGWQAWQRAGQPTRAGLENPPARIFTPQIQPALAVSAAEVDALRLDPAYRLCDSRAAERYRGQNETIDPVAGHIPGAISTPYAENLNPDGAFRSPAELRQRFEAILSGVPASQAVFYCGSGVTAIHNILALEVAGLGQARLFPGSWSEWITDPNRPAAI